MASALEISWRTTGSFLPANSFKGALGMEVYPALLGVGYIVGPKTASYMFAGSLVGWMVIIPLICLFGANISLYPAAAGTTIADLYAAGGADAIWSNYVKYIGAGAIATGGIISLIKSLPLIVSTFRDAMKSMKGGSASGTSRTEKDMPRFSISMMKLMTPPPLWQPKQ